MPIQLPRRRSSDSDFDAYYSYVQRVSAHETAQPAQPLPYTAWFQWKYGATPLETPGDNEDLVRDGLQAAA
tara:strand:+ start:2929 stop:3141 length:213 start_codon:yes stop_codon:yes gene_type:complete